MLLTEAVAGLILLPSALLLGVGALLLLQGRWTRARTPVLPPAAGPHDGVAHPRTGGPGADQPALRLLLIGDSTVAGVGAPTHELGLAGQTASSLARRTGRSVHWHAVGLSGITVRRARAELVGSLPTQGVDLVGLVFGVNDAVGLSSAGAYRRDLLALATDVRRRLETVPLLLSGVPPLGVFPALPQPLRAFLGWRGRRLDRAAERVAGALAQCLHVATRPQERADFAPDGYHPGPGGYATWGGALGEGFAALLTPREGPAGSPRPGPGAAAGSRSPSRS